MVLKVMTLCFGTTYFLYLAFCFPSLSSSSNIDTKHPVIFQNSVDDDDSLFGTTVKLLKKDISQVPWMIVGAPKGNSTHGNIHEPGVVWRCSVQSEPRCEQIVMDPTGNSEDLKNGVIDRKDEGWLGGSISSGESSRFVSCASRWVNQKMSDTNNLYIMNGICYWRNTDSITGEIITSELPKNYRLLPLVASQFQKANNMNLGQAGFSIHVSADNKEIMIGAPGVNAWTGSVIRYFDSDSSNLSDSDLFNQSVIMRPESDKVKMERNSLFGYSVTAGKFVQVLGNSSRQTQYVVGAPRANSLNGSVLLFYFLPNQTNQTNQTNQWESLQEIEGSQLGSYFGSVVCSVDVNGDGWDDLLVGAPHQSNVFKLLGTRILLDRTKQHFGGPGDEGAVFVYLGGSDKLPKTGDLVSGQNVAWSQFGSSIAAIGDINQDGFNDVAIGAPYENSGSGTVYIYHGSAKGLQMQYSQVIKASSVDWTLKGFGYSLSDGVDIDNNGFNDIAVGSYNSAQSVVLRSVPFAKVLGVLRSDINGIEFKKIPLNTTRFEIDSCISYEGQNLPKKIDFQVKISIDVEEKPPRVLLKPLPAEELSEYTYEEEVYEKRTECTKVVAIVSKDLEHSGKPVVIQQEISLPPSAHNFDDSNPTKYNITQSSGHIVIISSGAGYDTFCKNCPLINPNFPSKFSLSLPLAVKCGDNDICESELLLKTSFKDIENATFIVGYADSLALQIYVTNEGETAIAPILLISWPQRRLKKIPPNCQAVQMQTGNQVVSYSCTLGRLLENKQNSSLLMEFDMSDLITGGDTSQKMWFAVEAQTVSEMVTKPVVDNLTLSIVRIASLALSGRSSETFFNPNTVQPTIDFQQSYWVNLTGPSSVTDVTFIVRIPANLTSGSGSEQIFRIYDPQVTGVATNDVSCQSTADPNSDAVMMQPSISTDRKLRKRETAADADEKRNSDLDNISEDSSTEMDSVLIGGPTFIGKFGTSKRLLFNCGAPYIQCAEMMCKIRVLYPNSTAIITIKMEITSDDYRRLSRIHKSDEAQIVSKASVTTQGQDPGINITSEEATYTTVIKLESAAPLANWIIPVAVVAGIALLSIIIFVMYTCGCFKKRKPVPVEPESIPLKENIDEGGDEDKRRATESEEENKNTSNT